MFAENMHREQLSTKIFYDIDIVWICGPWPHEFPHACVCECQVSTQFHTYLSPNALTALAMELLT